MSKNGGRRRKDGPRPKHTQRCPDCEIRGALKEPGLPRLHPDYGFSLSLGCAGCEGTGRVPLWYR